jgi:glycosyltransferase involved in cell wall biosynthesis
MKQVRVASYRPGVASNGTAFEAMALIYKYIQKKYGWKFTIYKDEFDNFSDNELEVVSIPNKARTTVLKSPLPKNVLKFNKHVVQELKSYDLLLGCDPATYQQGVHAAYVSKKFGIPFAFDASITVMGRGRSLDWKLQSRFTKWAMKQSSIVWVTVPKTAERYRDLEIRGEEIASQFVVLGHPVDTEKFYPMNSKKDSSRIEILCVSRLVMEKGIHYIIEAVAPIIRENPNVVLRIVGNGECKGFLQKIIDDEGINKNVEFVEPVPHSQLSKLYNSADIFVGHPVSISNWEEFFGVVNVEAMACGLPVVTSKCGGISHVMREEGIAKFVEERDIIATTQAIKELVENDALRKDMAKKARSYVERTYSLPIIAEKYKRYLDSIL